MTKVTGNYHRKMPSGAELNITIEAENYYEFDSSLTFLLDMKISACRRSWTST